MLRTVTMIAAGLALAASPALAQAVAAEHWQVLRRSGSATTFARTPTGTPSAMKVQIMNVFGVPAPPGVDRVTLNWVVDCVAHTVNNVSGTTSLRGTEKKGVWNSATGEEAVVPEADSIGRVVFDFACSGKRLSDDTTVLNTADDAYGYGLKLAE